MRVLCKSGCLLLTFVLAAGAYESRRAVAREDAEETTTRVTQLESEISQLRSQIHNGVTGGYEGGGYQGGCGGYHGGCGGFEGGCGYAAGCGGYEGGCGGYEGGCGGYEGGCGGCDCCCCDPCCRSEGWVGGAELVYLKPHNSSGTGFNTFGVSTVAPVAAINLEVDPEFKETGRFWFGWQRCDGLGVRLRYWEFDHAFSEAGTVAFGAGAPTAATAFHAWDTYVVDAEVTDSSKLGCYWDATWSLGFRYVEYEEVRSILVPGAAFIAASKNFTGIGTTASFELRRQVTDTIGLFGSARASVLMDDDNNALVISIGGTNIVITERQINDVKYIFESQMGLEWTAPICGGGNYFARAGVEMQYWNNFGVSPISVLFDETAGFGGFFAAVGVNK